MPHLAHSSAESNGKILFEVSLVLDMNIKGILRAHFPPAHSAQDGGERKAELL